MDTLRLSPIRKPPSVPEVVVAEIQRLVAAGGLRLGDRLPPERELAELLGVGRSSIREAIHALEMMGLVEVRHGTGAFLAGEPGRWLLEPLKWASDSQMRLFRDLIEARLSVEVTLAQLAAERATEEDLAALREAAQRRAAATAGQYLETGFAFHQAVAQAAHNQVLAFMLSAAKHLYFDVLAGLEQAREPLAAFRMSQQAGHGRILAAIERHDVRAAGEAMREHLAEILAYYPRLASGDTQKGGATTTSEP
jgi:GntR family transcriptional repressor for pyruvate dehydrogenase complex